MMYVVPSSLLNSSNSNLNPLTQALEYNISKITHQLIMANSKNLEVGGEALAPVRILR